MYVYMNDTKKGPAIVELMTVDMFVTHITKAQYLAQLLHHSLSIGGEKCRAWGTFVNIKDESAEKGGR
jgi:hypothetical protein